MFGLGNKKPEAKAQREAENILADLRQELQDMDIMLINTNNNRNAILQKIAYFENKLPIVIDKSSGQAEVTTS